MRQILTTQAVAKHERVSYWVDMICSTYVKLECDPVAERSADFDGAIEHHGLAGLDLSVVRSGPQTVIRTRAAIARDAEDCFLIATQTRGVGIVEQDGRETVMTPGDFSIYQSTRPYRLRFSEDFEEIVLKVRGEALRAVVRDAESLTAMKVSGAPGRLLHGLLQNLRSDLDAFSPITIPAIGDGLLSLVAGGLQTLRGAAQPDPSSLKSYHLARIRRHIDEHLNDPALTIESVARELGMSVAHLHRLFATEPQSAAQYLWQRRLDRCCRDLTDVRLAERSVSDIGFHWGFNDAAHFSRTFRERFGCPPREWRQRALQVMSERN